MPAKPKIAAYVRVSTTGQNLKSQKHSIRQWAQSQHIPASEIRFYEDKKTGETINRPSLDRLLWAIDKGRIDCLVCFKLDRIARNTIDGLKLLASLADKGVRVVSVSEQIDFSNATGKLIASVLFSVASFENSVRKERQAAGIQAARLSGVHCGRPRDDKKLAKVRELRDKGIPVADIAKRLKCTRQNIYAALRQTAA